MFRAFGFIQVTSLDYISIFLEKSLPYIYILGLIGLTREIWDVPYSTRNGLGFCLMYHLVFNLILKSKTIESFDIICDGIFIAILTSDLILAKMAKRDLHPWIVIFAMVSIFNPWIILGLGTIYYFTIFYELCQALNLYMFIVNQNVYVDGIYDLCHLGHKMLFNEALKFGNRLIVGVISDEDAAHYKRRPIMNLDERVSAVQACKNVHKVIPGAPCFGLPKVFIEEYNIHIVAHSEEYDREDDYYYKIPRKMGITRILPRTDGMSTTELIRRTVKYHSDIVKYHSEKIHKII